ncbi:Phosphoenolpyruvate-protein phosphotransferase [Clavibacter michiganensis subsp. michiganensis]|uniref:Phosphoenolpyruvate-protein phosphotransferase n=1 Tax=Clavibacter michiganensis subsp. michiganensis TaxID=33013 RepID=A0A251XKF9_CLAMM|nr:Phosphoenolpyruvate-protein phosphotransferase [Clavibacter michiganensis subsp. michiganensis]OUE03972.1 Phosphoenolpyruvate-protein phosphotransferase [Clavibacter michiganensis subsp. michiganensis]
MPDPDHAFVLVARDLAPADTALLDLDKVLALITTDGGPTSHTAILAREKAIVAVVGVAAATDLADGETVVVDALTGAVTVAPTPEEESAARDAIAARKARVDVPTGPGALSDGTAIRCSPTSDPPTARPTRSRRAPRASASSAPSSSSSTPRARRRSTSSARTTRACSRRSPGRRSSCARSTPAPTSR